MLRLSSDLEHCSGHVVDAAAAAAAVGGHCAAAAGQEGGARVAAKGHRRAHPQSTMHYSESQQSG